MNVLYILGNGFDLAQRMETRYRDFYQYLMKTDCSSLLELMKKEIREDKEEKLWSDMEKALGDFTKKVKTVEEMDSLHAELSRHLQNYLKAVDSKFKPDLQKKNKIKRDFQNPGQYLTRVDWLLYNDYCTRIVDASKDIDYEVMTFNYTNTFEKFIGNQYVFNESKQIKLNRVYHVHGQLDNAILVGVNDTSQIENVDFRNSDIITSFFVKEKANEALENNYHIRGRNLIRAANLVVLFGVSFGDTDKLWWDLLGNQLKNREDIAVICFLHCDNNVRRERPFDLKRIKTKERIKLYSKLGIKYPSEEIDERFFIAINTGMFSGNNLNQ